MAVSRPLLIALVGAVLLAAFFFATRALQGGAEVSVEAPPTATPGPPSQTAERRPRSRPSSQPDASRRRPTAGGTAARRVRRALASGDVVVFLFSQPGAGDDAATAKALDALDTGRVTVLKDRVGDIGDYGPLVASAGITQAPATVVIGPDRTARVLEGYHDAGSLRQAVRDARR